MEIVYLTMSIYFKDVYVTMCVYVVIVWLTIMMKCEWYVFDLVIKWRCEYMLYSCDDDLRFCCIYLVNQMRMHVNMILLKMNICLYYVMSPNTMHAFVSSLCWTYILPSSGFWSPSQREYPRTAWRLLVFL